MKGLYAFFKKVHLQRLSIYSSLFLKKKSALYFRKYSLSSSPLQPAWIPFTSRQTAEERLEFDLKLMTGELTSITDFLAFILCSPL